MNKERLLKLADHLEYGKLGHESFNFKQITTVTEIGNFCGTNGCGIGECPIAFSDDWEFKRLKVYDDIESGLVTVGLKSEKDATYYSPFKGAKEYFELDTLEVEILFVPICDIDNEIEEIIINYEDDDEGWNPIEAYIYINEKKFYGLNWGATKEDLAKNIRKFVELKEANATI